MNSYLTWSAAFYVPEKEMKLAEFCNSGSQSERWEKLDPFLRSLSWDSS